jgi:ABC-2 type transport system ATP-binding protein
MADPRPALVITGLHKRFGGLEAVAGLSLAVTRGEIYAFLGPNGAGKTTTIKSIAGLLRPEAGEIVVSGHKVRPDAVEFRRALGYVPDRPFLYEKLTAWEYLEFLASVHGLVHWEKEAEEYLALFKLAQWRHQLVEGFSHGMRQKLVLTGALLHRPDLLLVDEPMVGLDPRSARDVKDLFVKLAACGTGLFLSTHSLDLASELAHRIGILNNGRMVAEGTFGHLQIMARQPGSTLEEVFLRLTEEEADIPDQIAKPAGGG